MTRCLVRLAACLFSLTVPVVGYASARITEIMYDLPGTDTGREWVEVENTGSDDISFAKWKFFEANTNHGLVLFQGNATTSASGFAVIADNPAKFLADNPSYSGALFGSSFSLSNTGETLELKFENASIFQVSYVSSAGAAGDGNSLQLVNGVWQAAAPTPGAAPGGSAASGTVSSSTPASTESGVATTTEQTALEPSPPPANKGGSAWTFTPQLYVNAFVPARGVAGAPLVFDAVAVGVKKELIPNARYVWSFGDGGTVEGKKVQHTYHYPAVYVVMVTAASGEWNATDRKEVTIAAPELVISEVREGAVGFIEVHNDGGSDVDMSHWMLLSGSGIFSIPQGTIIAAGKSVPFPSAITNLSADFASIALLYPNGSVAVAYAEKQTAPAPSAQPVERAVTTVTAPVESASDTTVALATLPVPRRESRTDIELIPEPMREDTPLLLPTASSTSSTRSEELFASIGAAKARHTLPWLGGAVLIVLLAAGGYVAKLLSEREQSAADALRKEADEYDLIE